MNIHSALLHGKNFLRCESQGLRSAEILLQFTLNVSRAHLYAHSEQILSDIQMGLYQNLIQQRHQGVPIAYLTKQRSFWKFDLMVSSDTLIPRPETEILIEQILNLTDLNQTYSLLDLGTGSGAIALAIACERPHWQIKACDESMEALCIAKHNAQLLQLESIQFIQSDWFEEFSEQRFDIIVANPPYLANHDPHLKEGDLRYEPKSALISGPDGLDDLRFIINHSCKHLNKHGLLIVEHGFEQSGSVLELFNSNGYHSIQSWSDLQGHLRICGGRKY